MGPTEFRIECRWFSWLDPRMPSICRSTGEVKRDEAEASSECRLGPGLVEFDLVALRPTRRVAIVVVSRFGKSDRRQEKERERERERSALLRLINR